MAAGVQTRDFSGGNGRGSRRSGRRGVYGDKLGTVILWAVVAGAFFKFVLNEGLTRWQLATGDTLLEGGVRYFGVPFRSLFVFYLIPWSFLVAMVIIGQRAGPFSKSGSALLVELSETLRETIGPVASWVFLIGAWGAVFSSLLGVWQSVPYLCTDFSILSKHHAAENPDQTRSPVDTQSWAYQGYLYALGTLPAIGLFVVPFRQALKVYAVLGAFSLPLIALILLLLCGPDRYLGGKYRNRPFTNLLLLLILLFFGGASGWTIWPKLG